MIEIIPAIDLIGGRCVRLLQGDFNRQTIYDVSPVEMAERFAEAGYRRLHIVDLDGARSGCPQNLPILEAITAVTDLVIDYGGGIRSTKDLINVFNAGAAMANIGSIAVRRPDTVCGWIDDFGEDRILIGADVLDGHLAIDGWQTATGQNLEDFLGFYVRRGLRKVFVTDVGRDGSFTGPATELYKKILASFPGLNLIASGGIRNLADIRTLEDAGCSGAIVGKAFYEDRIKPEEIKNYVSQKNNSLS
ncbi:MAG: 1-(5-phosphoribosyl)-5-[(5-phosphoribosylamino)methylideneamino] imidazole-4-carboxamide isomerase [Acidobacteriota bacterium]|jgi:phosphoribosylformimino-5-aminoimidazole carboxamide ribotide isomerase